MDRLALCDLSGIQVLQRNALLYGGRRYHTKVERHTEVYRIVLNVLSI